LKALAKKISAQIQSWMDLHCNINLVARYDLLVLPFSEWKENIKAKYGVDDSSVYVCTLVDMNVPHCKVKERLEALMRAVQRLNDSNATNNIAVVICPDRPRGASRGVTDSEATLEKELWALQQHCDTRFVLPFNLKDPRAEAHTNMRRFAMGRLVANHKELASNKWMSASQLCVAGRPLGDFEVGIIPPQRDLTLPESTDPNSDIKIAERQRPSPDQVSALKGCQVSGIMLNSLFADMNFSDQDVVLVVNLTGYVEDMALTKLTLDSTIKNEVLKDAPKRLHYISFHIDANLHDFASKRVTGHILDEVVEGKMVLPGLKIEKQAPPLTEKEIQLIPGGTAASGDLSALKLNCCCQAGEKLVIN